MATKLWFRPGVEEKCVLSCMGAYCFITIATINAIFFSNQSKSFVCEDACPRLIVGDVFFVSLLCVFFVSIYNKKESQLSMEQRHGFRAMSV